MSRNAFHFTILAVCFGLYACVTNAAEPAVTVFAARATTAEKEVYKDFEKETGIAVQLVEGKVDELIERIAAAGDTPEADLFITVDGGILDRAKQKGIFQAADSDVLRGIVPSWLRDRDNAWIGVTTRARVIVYSKDRVKLEELSTYMDLADPKWKGRLLVRSSGNLYNQSLVAAFIGMYGEERVTEWVDGIAANLAREPKGGDRDQAKGIAEGIADVAIMNSYYIGHMLNSKDQAEVAAGKAVGVFFPDQNGAGTHINICGIGLVKDSANAEAAIKLVEYMLSVPAQEKLSAGNYEFPVNHEAKKAPLLEGWGDFRTAKIDFAAMNENKTGAKAILEASDWK